MPRLEELTPGSRLEGLVGGGAVTVLQAQWHGSGAVTLTYRDDNGHVGQELVYRDDEPRIVLQEAGRPWSFDADGDLFRLAVGVSTDPSGLDVRPVPRRSDVESRSASAPDRRGVRRMLDRQPLRFLLADDPGAGKTIMAGLYIKELMIRGDVERCLIVAPGSLVTQWQDELWDRFRLDFDILTRDQIEAARTGNPFSEKPRLDRPTRSALAQRGHPRQARRERLGSGDLRRGAQDVGAPLWRRGQEDQALRARPSRSAASRGTSC